MIASLRGKVAEKGLADVIVDVNGVGYRVALSLLGLARLPEVGAELSLRIRTVVREEAFDLYGFLSEREEQLFLLLTSVSHVGPKLALTILSGLEVDDLARAIAGGETPRLTKIHGVGKKTAERVVLELRDKVKPLLIAEAREQATAGEAPSTASRAELAALKDLISALVNLGYKSAHAEQAAAAAAERLGADAPFEALFREGLQSLRKS